MLRTGAIRSERGLDDGLRVSVMSRHTYDGDPVRRDPSIRPDLFDLWIPELAPTGRQVGEWYRSDKRREAWESFEALYRARLMSSPQAWLHMGRISELAIRSNVTLLCSEPVPDFCHRRILAEEMQERFPALHILLA